MAKHDVDPVLRQLVRAVNESGQAAVPVTVSLHGTALTGMLIAQDRYFSDLVEGNPIGLKADDGWTLRARPAGEDDKGPFARLLGTA